jgi:hypothetical protein
MYPLLLLCGWGEGVATKPMIPREERAYTGVRLLKLCCCCW